MGRKSWSNDKLLYRLITNKSNKTYWLNISELRKRASPALFEQCILLTKSDVQKERMIGVNILSQLSSPPTFRPYSKKVIVHFLNLLKVEKTPLVLMSILYGIGHNNENLVQDKAIKCIANYRTNENDCVREGVVAALLGIDNAIAVNALIELSRDKCSHIRDWAVFGLGSLIETDTTEIREALYARIYDKHKDTRYEAILGLARRNDPKVKDVIIQELLSASYTTYLFEAIKELPDAAFIPLLENNLMKYKDDIDINSEWIDGLKDCINNLKSCIPQPSETN